MNTFEGQSQANSFAELESKKTKGEQLVYISRSGKLHYGVASSLDKVPSKAKVIGRYSNGERV